MKKILKNYNLIEGNEIKNIKEKGGIVQFLNEISPFLIGSTSATF